MKQLRLAYSDLNASSPLRKSPSRKFKMLRASLSGLPPLASKMIQLQETDPATARVIEKLVDDALRRRAG